MRLGPLLQQAHRLWSWARTRQLFLLTVAGAALLVVIGIVDWASTATRRSDILFLVQVGGLIFLIVYVIATNRIAQANQIAARATEESSRAARQAVEAASHSLRISEAMLAETKATRIAQEMQSAPHVVVYAEMEGLVRYLAVENTGLSFANNVTVTFTPPLPQNMFPAGYMPDFFTGTVFTLKPGQKLRQPLSQEYRPIIGAVPQAATARYRGGLLADEVEETFPINLSGFEKILVTQSEVEQALAKMDRLATAVEQTGEALKAVTKRLNQSIPVSVMLLNEQRDTSNGATGALFHRFIGGLSDEWHLWQERQASQYHMRRPIERRLQQLLEATLSQAAHLPIPDEDARHVRSVLFDIQSALTSPYPDQNSEHEDVITRSLAELREMAKRWDSLDTESSSRQAETHTSGDTTETASDNDEDS